MYTIYFTNGVILENQDTESITLHLLNKSGISYITRGENYGN